jgi:hypothetical protein
MQRCKTQMTIYAKENKQQFRAQVITAEGFRGFTYSIQGQ